MLANYLKFAAGFLLQGMVVYTVFRLCFWRLLKKREMCITACGEAAAAILAAYFIILFAVTISPDGGIHIPVNLSGTNIIPFQTIGEMQGDILEGSGHAVINVLGNIVLFIPVGLLFPFLSNYFQRLRRTVLAGAVISATIELLQLFLTRGTDIDDVLLNTLGTIAGFGVFKLFMKLFPAWKSQTGVFLIRMKKRCKLRKDGTWVVVMTFVLLCTVWCTGYMRYRKLILPGRTMVEDVGAKQEQKISRLPLEGKNICVADGEGKMVLYDKKCNEKIAPASTAKLVTAMVVMDHCQLAEQVSVGEEVNFICPESSRAGICPGNLLTIEMLLKGLLLPSGNDAAYALAAYTGQKIADGEEAGMVSIDQAIEIFVKEMNQKAKELGAKASRFKVPDGFDSEGQYTTAYNMLQIACGFLKYDELLAIARMPEARVVSPDGIDVTYQNTNLLLHPDSPYYRENAVGLKTGTSDAAGECLIAAENIGGKIYVSVVMNAPREGRFQDAGNIFEALSTQ